MKIQQGKLKLAYSAVFLLQVYFFYSLMFTQLALPINNLFFIYLKLWSNLCLLYRYFYRQPIVIYHLIFPYLVYHTLGEKCIL